MTHLGGNIEGLGNYAFARSREHARTIKQMLARGAAAQSEVVASWDRCVRLHKLDPEGDCPEIVASRYELQEEAAAVECYIRMADRELNSLTKQLAKLGFFVSVASVNGIAITHRGNVPDLGASKTKTSDGMCWRENAQGTNAIGTTLYSQRPTVIYQSEHFYSANSLMTCLATPLFGPTGALLGALNATTVDRRVDRGLATVLLSLLVGSAQKMEGVWFRDDYPESLVISIPEVTSISGSSAMLAVDPDLNVLGATQAARTHCGITGDAMARGVHLDQIDTGARLAAPSLPDAERTTLKRALALSGQNVSVAATRLGISRTTMHRKMAAFKLLRGR
jgi:transcriptional regulator of acetoin/glycerol metabolism